MVRAISCRTSSFLQIACKLLMCVCYQNVWLPSVEPEEEQRDETQPLLRYTGCRKGLRWGRVAFCQHTHIHTYMAVWLKEVGDSRVHHHLSGTSAGKFSKHCADVRTWPRPSTRRNVCIFSFPPWMQSRTAEQLRVFCFPWKAWEESWSDCEGVRWDETEGW